MNPDGFSRLHTTALLVLFFVSGFAALVYQVMWVRELGLLFGSTAQAAALTIAIFFAGLGAGSWFWGRRAPGFTSSLRWFGVLEIGVAVTALGYFVLVDAYHAAYPALYAAVGHSPVLDTLAKAAIAATILFAPAFLMGGTLPLMGQHLIRVKAQLGRAGAKLYGVNTAGSACGALAAGFVLPLALGFRNAYLLAVGLDLAVGMTAVLLARFAAPPPDASIPETEPPPESAAGFVDHDGLPGRLIASIAFASGFTTLAVEVIWTRLFAQVLQNSVYTYALVLSAFLVALALGALLANLLCRERRFPPHLVLGLLLGLSGLAIAVSPVLFTVITNDLAYVGAERGWAGYVFAVGGVAVIVMLIPGIVFGAVLPYLFRLVQDSVRQPGDLIGRLVSIDTFGAILGALAGGFVLLPLLGAWRSLFLLAAVYPVLLAAVALTRMPRQRLSVAATAVAAALLIATANPQTLQDVRFGARGGERLIAAREGAHATAAVVELVAGGYVMRVNNYYTLGGTNNVFTERNQTVIPMLTHPEPESVFFLGMGTGITAGAALAFPVERVVVTELLPEVVALSRAHFGPWINGLFEDPRAVIHAEDGRNVLARSPEKFSVIISDLFTPWKAGTGNLYTLENYRNGYERLKPGGLYVQWIPLYQVSERELAIIGRTMDEVFPQVTLWRGDLFAERSIAALVGHKEAAPLEPSAIARQGRRLASQPKWDGAFYEALALRHYAGNVSESGIFSEYPLNTDNYPLIEYLAPRTHRLARTGEARFLIGAYREDFYERLRTAVPPETDPYLAQLTETQRDYVRAGHAYSRYMYLKSQSGRRDEALEYYQAYERKLGSSLTDLLVPEGISLDLIELDHNQTPEAAG